MYIKTGITSLILTEFLLKEWWPYFFQQIISRCICNASVTVECGMTVLWSACQTCDREVAGWTPGHFIIR